MPAVPGPRCTHLTELRPGVAGTRESDLTAQFRSASREVPREHSKWLSHRFHKNMSLSVSTDDAMPLFIQNQSTHSTTGKKPWSTSHSHDTLTLTLTTARAFLDEKHCHRVSGHFGALF